VICYFKIKELTQINSLEVENSILMEIYPEQQNIIHAKINGNRKSLLLTNDNKEGILEF